MSNRHAASTITKVSNSRTPPGSDDPRAAQQAFGAQWEACWRGASDATDPAPWQPSAGAPWTEAPDGLGNWKAWARADLQEHNGMVWFRTTVDLTAAQAECGAVLALGGIDEVDQTWTNGQVVGGTFG